MSGAPADAMLSKNDILAFLGEKKHCWAAGISISLFYLNDMTADQWNFDISSVKVKKKLSAHFRKVNKNHISRTQIVN